MKVVIIAPDDSIHVRRWCAYARQHGYDIYYIKRHHEERLPGVKQIILPQPCPRFCDSEIAEELKILQEAPDILFQDKHVYAMRLKTYRDILKEIEPDIVHAHWLFDHGLHAVLAARGIAPFMQSVWGSDVFIIPVFFRRHIQQLQYVLSNAQMVLGNSGTLVDMAVSFLNYEPGPETRVFKWGLLPEFEADRYDRAALRKEYGYKKDDVILISTRGFKPVYNIRTVLHAFERARREYSRLKLILMGRGLGWENYDPEDSDHCRVMDAADHETVARLMAMSDIVISIPYSDSMANTLVEALSMEKYLVTSDLPAIREYINPDIHAALVNASNREEVAAAIIRYFEEPEQCRKMAEAGRKMVGDTFTEENALADVARIYEDITKGKARGKCSP